MRYYVKLEKNGLIDQGINVFGTFEEAKMCKSLSESAGFKATIYNIELREVPE